MWHRCTASTLTFQARTGFVRTLAAFSKAAGRETSHRQMQVNIAQSHSTNRSAICAFTSSSHALVPQRVRQSHRQSCVRCRTAREISTFVGSNAPPRSHLRTCLQRSRRCNTVLPNCHADDDLECCATMKNGMPTSESLRLCRPSLRTVTASIARERCYPLYLSWSLYQAWTMEFVHKRLERYRLGPQAFAFSGLASTNSQLQ